MSSTAKATLDAFQQWIVDAVSSAGVAVGEDVDPFGLEFESEGRLARIIPHSDPGLAVIEVEVRSLAEVEPNRAHRLAWELLSLNHETRFQHQWAAILDEDRTLSITSTVAIASTPGEALAETLFDGVERASQLATVADELLAALDSDAQALSGLSSQTLRV